MIGSDSNILWSKADNKLIKFSNLDDIVMGGIQFLVLFHITHKLTFFYC